MHVIAMYIAIIASYNGYCRLYWCIAGYIGQWVSGSIKDLFSTGCVNIYFSQSIVNYLFSIFFQ